MRYDRFILFDESGGMWEEMFCGCRYRGQLVSARDLNRATAITIALGDHRQVPRNKPEINIYFHKLIP